MSRIDNLSPPDVFAAADYCGIAASKFDALAQATIGLDSVYGMTPKQCKRMILALVEWSGLSVKVLVKRNCGIRAARRQVDTWSTNERQNRKTALFISIPFDLAERVEKCAIELGLSPSDYVLHVLQEQWSGANAHTR